MKKVHHTLEKVGQCQFLFWLTIYMFGSMETKARGSNRVSLAKFRIKNHQLLGFQG